MSTDTVIDVTAGSTVTAIWRHTLTSGPDSVMDPSHLGPTLAYLKKVDDAKTDPGPGDGWFKIQEDGYSGGVWGTSKVINDGGKHQIKIPDCIEPGQYLLRAEMIALHGAGTYPGAQFYMECAQLNIVGGSGAKTPDTHAIPGIYKVSLLLGGRASPRERLILPPDFQQFTYNDCVSREPTLASKSASTTP